MTQIVCPYCAYVADRFTCVTETGATYKNGDISICAGCVEISIFDDTANGGVRKPDRYELDDVNKVRKALSNIDI